MVDRQPSAGRREGGPGGQATGGRRAMRTTAAATAAEPSSVSATIRMARRAARSGRLPLALDVLEAAVGAVGDTGPAAARLRAAAALVRLNAGESDVDWERVSTTCLALATDPADGWTPDLIADAADVAFHRTLHLDSPLSPWVQDRVGVLDQFHRQPVIAAARQRPLRDAGPTVVPDRAVLVHQGNLNFATGVRSGLERDHDVAVVDLWESDPGIPQGSHALVADVIAGRCDTWFPAVDRVVGAPGVVWAEWAQLQALVVSHALAPGTRLVVRLHAAELFTAGVQFLQWRRVSALVVVSAPMAAAVRRILPLPPDLPVHVVANHIDPRRFTTAKTDDSRWTLALVGHNSHVKDPAYALDVLDLVRREEPRARLLLVGDPLTADSPAQGPGTAAYVSEYEPRLAAAIETGTVTVTGQTDAVAAALTGAGFILSTSRRESFHQGLLEGALAGCVPVVRDWPAMSPFGGPASFLPARWVGHSPQELADRILGFMSDPKAWEDERHRARVEAEELVGDPTDPRLAAIIGQ